MQESEDEEQFIFKQTRKQQIKGQDKQQKQTIIDEDSDEEFNDNSFINEQSWFNINENYKHTDNYDNLFDDESGEDLYDFDMYSVRSVSDEDENDSFIDDNSTEYNSIESDDEF